MCGIAGFAGDFDRALLPAMSRLLAHRGPDDHGEFAAPEAGSASCTEGSPSSIRPRPAASPWPCPTGRFG